MINQIVGVFFYVASEVLGSTLMSFVFMTYFNDNLTPFQMSRYIRPIYIGANISLIMSGRVVRSTTKWISGNIPASEAWKEYSYALIGVSVCLGIIFAFKKQMDKLFDKPLYEKSGVAKKKKSKAKVSAAETIKLLFASPLLAALTTASVGYNFCTTVVSVRS